MKATKIYPSLLDAIKDDFEGTVIILFKEPFNLMGAKARFQTYKADAAGITPSKSSYFFDPTATRFNNWMHPFK